MYPSHNIILFFSGRKQICLQLERTALKERYKVQILYHVNNCRIINIDTCIQCGLGILLNLPFKAIPL
jgi:hypothetical protein